VAIGETSDQGSVDVRAYWKPFVRLIWLGPLIMAIGGLISLADRRLRIGAPLPARAMRPGPAE
jgi:cytochrome c-type biogenesis protein CcmF